MPSSTLLAPRSVLIGGGARSGKSQFALQRALTLGQERVWLATAQAFDEEMEARIAAHRRERGDAFRTLEEPLELEARLSELRGSAEVVVVDCLTLWLSNLLLGGLEEAEVLQRVEALAQHAMRPHYHLLLVTNEVGLGLVPDSALGRRFRDLSGRLHQQLAKACDEVYLGAMGLLLRLKPAPIEAVSPLEGACN